ncbi:MAG: hypothetical protein RL708_974 [Bacteroidota bacterium]|jgi:hypothetical protein
MNKTFISKASKPLMFSALALLLITQTGCFGSFSLTKKVYEFNKGVSSSKVVQNIVFWAFCIVPVYEICSFVDAIILNLLEFWTGSNPLSMTEGQREEQLVKGKDGNQYKMIATKNQFEIVAMSGDKIGKSTFMKFNESEKSWSYVDGSTSTKISQISTNENNEAVGINYFDAKGNVVKTISMAEASSKYESYAASKLMNFNSVASK